MSSERGGGRQEREREHGGGAGGAGGGGGSSAGRGMGLAKAHTITHPTEGTREITQAEWKAQGKQLRAEGWTRPDDDGTDEAPTTETTGPVGETSSGELQSGTIASDVAPPAGGESTTSGESGAGESTSTS